MEEGGLIGVSRTRLVAAASLTALGGALVVTVPSVAASSESPGAGVTFSSQRTVATLVAHYVVSPVERGENSAITASSPETENRTITLSPKGDRVRSSNTAKA